MKTSKNQPLDQKVNLPQDDQELLSNLDGFCVSEKEKSFLSKMLDMEQHYFTEIGAPVVLENENEDHLYIIRYYSSEYEIGNDGLNGVYNAFSLSELLNLYLDEYDILDRHITVLEWLRQRDYKNVTYNRTYDSK